MGEGDGLGREGVGRRRPCWLVSRLDALLLMVDLSRIRRDGNGCCSRLSNGGDRCRRGGCSVLERCTSPFRRIGRVQGRTRVNTSLARNQCPAVIWDVCSCLEAEGTTEVLHRGKRHRPWTRVELWKKISKELQSFDW